MNKHEIKILPEYFELLFTPHGGVKRFELRKNDRDYKVGDVVTLKEWTGTEYTGNGAAGELTRQMCSVAIEALEKQIAEEEK